MRRRGHSSVAPVNVIRVLPVAGEPLKQHHSLNSKMPQALASVRHERNVEHVHALGPRPLYEMLAEIAIATGEPGIVADRVEAYAELNPELIRAIGANHFPPPPMVLI